MVSCVPEGRGQPGCRELKDTAPGQEPLHVVGTGQRRTPKHPPHWGMCSPCLLGGAATFPIPKSCSIPSGPERANRQLFSSPHGGESRGEKHSECVCASTVQNAPIFHLLNIWWLQQRPPDQTHTETAWDSPTAGAGASHVCSSSSHPTCSLPLGQGRKPARCE